MEEHSVFNNFFRKNCNEKEVIESSENFRVPNEKWETLNDKDLSSKENLEKIESNNKVSEIKLLNNEKVELNENLENQKVSFESELKIKPNERKEEPKKNAIKPEEERRKSFDIQYKAAEIVARSEKLSFLKKKMDQILNQTNALPITPKNESDLKNMVIKPTLIILLSPLTLIICK